METDYAPVLLALPLDWLIALAMLGVACFISARVHGMGRPMAAIYIGSTAIVLIFLSRNYIDEPLDVKSAAEVKGAATTMGFIASMFVMLWFERTYKIYKKLYWNILMVINDTALCVLVITITGLMVMNLPAVSTVPSVDLMFECIIYFVLCIMACVFGSLYRSDRRNPRSL